MKKMNKRLISILLSIALVFGCVALAVPAFAEGEWNCETDGHEVVEDSYRPKNSSSHYFTCSHCGEKTEDHVFADGSTNGQCTKCGYIYDCSTKGHWGGEYGVYSGTCNDKTHSTVCKACSQTWERPHDFPKDGDGKAVVEGACSECGLEYEGCGTDNHFYEDNKDGTHTCIYCLDTVSHKLNAFGDCTACGFHDCENFSHSFKGGFEHDDYYHWKVCEYCDKVTVDEKEIFDSVDDIPEETKLHKDDNKDGKCDVCGFFCGHKWQLSLHTEPTCTTAGLDTYTCIICGETQENTIPALGHYWFNDAGIDGAQREYVNFEFSSNYESCTLTFKCKRPECGHTVSYTVYTSPSDNGAVYANSETSKPLAVNADPDCESGSGIAYYAIFTIGQIIVDMGLDDSEIDTIANQIDKDSNSTLKKSIEENPLDPRINVNDKGFICQLKKEDGEKAALGHKYENKEYMRYQDEDGNWVEGDKYKPNGDASCTKDGTRTAPCDRCGHVSDAVPDVGSAKGHDWGGGQDGKDEEGWFVTQAGDCTTPKIEKRVCGRCFEEETKTTLTNHDTTGNQGTPHPATCVEEGYTETLCNVCGQLVKDNFTPALGHNWGEWHVTKDPDCTNTGKRERACQRCGDTQTEDYGAALGHSFVYSSTDDGSGHIAKCERCGYTLGSSLAHVDADYDFLCDGCGAELKFWQHWLHYMVGLPTHAGVIMSRAFGDFFTKVVGFFTKYMINF